MTTLRGSVRGVSPPQFPNSWLWGQQFSKYVQGYVKFVQGVIGVINMLQVRAVDADGPGENSEVAYQLMGDSSFIVNPTTGEWS